MNNVLLVLLCLVSSAANAVSVGEYRQAEIGDAKGHIILKNIDGIAGSLFTEITSLYPIEYDLILQNNEVVIDLRPLVIENSMSFNLSVFVGSETLNKRFVALAPDKQEPKVENKDKVMATNRIYQYREERNEYDKRADDKKLVQNESVDAVSKTEIFGNKNVVKRTFDLSRGESQFISLYNEPKEALVSDAKPGKGIDEKEAIETNYLQGKLLKDKVDKLVKQIESQKKTAEKNGDELTALNTNKKDRTDSTAIKKEEISELGITENNNSNENNQNELSWNPPSRPLTSKRSKLYFTHETN